MQNDEEALLAQLTSKLEERKTMDLETGCWCWSGAKTKNGYGHLRVGNGVEYVHRLSARIHLGFDPAGGLYVLHVCDVRACFNPKHLFVGTQADNMRDAAMKGRIGRGKLDAAKVREIRRLLLSGATHAAVADRYGVSKSTISQIARGKIWAHVDAETTRSRRAA